MSALHRRAVAAQATFDAFVGTTFAWGERDCLRLAAHTMRGLGHNPKLARFGRYRSEMAAKRALLSAGFRDVADIVDDLGLPRIAPATALVGDIMGWKHPEQTAGWTGLAVHIGNHRVIAFQEDMICHPIEAVFDMPGGEWVAWRCDPCPS